MQYSRTKILFGEDAFKKFQDTKIILFGVGGIGSFALDALYNTGVTNITIVDFDEYEASNQNRQLGSHGNIGRKKVEVLKERYPNVTPICVKITPEWIDNFDFSSYDYILDAIDEYEKDNLATIEKLKKEKQVDTKKINGALKQAINAHGPITKVLIGSATKRIYGALLDSNKPKQTLIQKLLKWLNIK